MALDAQHVLLGGQTGDAGGQIGRVGDLGQVDDDGVEILMLVVVGAVVMAGAGVQVVLGGLAQAQDQARIDRALGHGQDGQGAGQLGLDRGAGGGDALRSGQIGLGQQDDIGAGDLILEDLGQGRLVVQAGVGGALRVHRRHVGGEATCCHGLGIGQGDHAVHGDARADGGPVEGLEQGLGQRQPGRLDQDVVRAGGKRHQRLQRGDEVVGDGAADAAVRQLDDVLGRAGGVGATLEDVAIHAHRAELVYDHRQAQPLGVGHQMAHQGRLARPQKAGDHGDGGLHKVVHGHSCDRVCGGMRARLCLRKTAGRSRHGTMPSAVPA